MKVVNEVRGGSVEIKVATSKDSTVFRDAMAIRLAVFVREQGVPETLERDADDAIATHYVGYMAGRPITTLRTMSDGNRLHIQRVATRQGERHHGYAAQLVTEVVARARRTPGLEIAYLGAQLPARGFYAQLGFKPQGAIFVEAGIEHQQMTIALK